MSFANFFLNFLIKNVIDPKIYITIFNMLLTQPNQTQQKPTQPNMAARMLTIAHVSLGHNSHDGHDDSDDSQDGGNKCHNEGNDCHHIGG